MSLLEQNTIKKGKGNKLSELEPMFNVERNKYQKVEAINESLGYTNYHSYILLYPVNSI